MKSASIEHSRSRRMRRPDTTVGIPTSNRVSSASPVTRCCSTRDAFDLQFHPRATLDDVASVDLDLLHPLTGPVYVEGAEPGDLLVIDVLEVGSDAYGYTAQVPGFGFLRDEFPDPFIVKWDIDGDYATSSDLPGVRVPGSARSWGSWAWHLLGS